MTGQEETRQQPLSVGDRIELRYGPFLSTWRVAKVLEHGAQLEYVGDVRFAGHRDVEYAPNGDQLTDSPDQVWLGRAHFAAATRLEAGAVDVMRVGRIHKAAPGTDPGRCAICGQRIKSVPGGAGPTWVHSDSGAVAAPNPPGRR